MTKRKNTNQDLEMQIIPAEQKPIKKLLEISDLIESFLDAQDIRPISKEVYKKGLIRFANWMESNHISQPDRTDILRFKTYLKECNLSINTVNSYLVSVKRFFAYLQGIRFYPDIAKGIKGSSQTKGHLKESPTISQVQDILSNIDISTIEGQRNFAMINLMARTGLRTIEIVRLNLEDIKHEGGEALLYVQGKGRDSKDEFVLLTEGSLKPIQAYLKARGKVKPGDPLFISHSDRNNGQRLTTRTVSSVAKNAYRQVGIDRLKLSAHSLRHFFATQSLKAGAPLLQVKEAMRHSSIETTQRYLHNLDRIKEGAERYIDF